MGRCSLYFAAARIDDALAGLAHICDEASKNALLAALPYRSRGKWRFIPRTGGAPAELFVDVAGLEAIEDHLMLPLPLDAPTCELVQTPAKPQGAVAEAASSVEAWLHVTVGSHYASVELSILNSDEERRFMQSQAIHRSLTDVLRGAGGLIGLLNPPWGNEHRLITDVRKSFVMDLRTFEVPLVDRYDVDALVPELARFS